MDKTEIFLSFIGGQGTILVRDICEFNKFRDLLVEHKVERILGSKPSAQSYAYWVDLSIINNKNPKEICFEYQPGKGLSFYNDTKRPTEWYGKAPMTL